MLNWASIIRPTNKTRHNFTVKDGLTEAFAYSQSDEFLTRLRGDKFVQTSSLAVLGGKFHGERLID